MGKIDRILENPPVHLPSSDVDTVGDRRIRGERVPVDFPVFAVLKGSPIQGFIQAVNLSWSGMLVATNFPLNLGDKIGVEFTLPNVHFPIALKARVIHKLPERVPEEATMIGLVFEEVEPNIERMIAGYVLDQLPIP
jgi:hypothetical protein